MKSELLQMNRSKRVKGCQRNAVQRGSHENRAVIGILVGLLIPAFVQQLLPGNLRVPVSSTSVIVAFLVSCATGLFFGYLPANQAAHLEPIESLRYE